jgi:hypothetical protein
MPEPPLSRLADRPARGTAGDVAGLRLLGGAGTSGNGSGRGTRPAPASRRRQRPAGRAAPASRSSSTSPAPRAVPASAWSSSSRLAAPVAWAQHYAESVPTPSPLSTEVVDVRGDRGNARRICHGSWGWCVLTTPLWWPSIDFAGPRANSSSPCPRRSLVVESLRDVAILAAIALLLVLTIQVLWLTSPRRK